MDLRSSTTRRRKTTATTTTDDESFCSADSEMLSYCIDFNKVKEAASRIEGVAFRTPILTNDAISQSFGKNIFFKVEALQRTGSFKFRGAYNAIQCALDEAATTITNNEINNNNGEGTETNERTTTSTNSNINHVQTTNNTSITLSVVTHSSGNHAQAVAWAAKLAFSKNHSSENTEANNNIRAAHDANVKSLNNHNISNIQATIVMPKSAPTIKKRATKEAGASIVLVENTNQAREEGANRILQQERKKPATNTLFLHSSEDPRVIAGQGTVCLEFVQQIKSMYNKTLDAVIIPVGGGGLACGNAIALRALLGNKVKIILAEPAKLDDAKRSFQAKKLLKHDPSNKLDSVADGLKTTLGPNTWPIVRDLVDDVFTVSEYEILKCTKLIWEQVKICIEPSAGVGVAVAASPEFQAKYPREDGIENVGIILCGGNVDIDRVLDQMKDMNL